MTVAEVMQPKAQRKLLALDGGGIRGLITIEILAAIEATLRRDRGQDFRLSHEFDYVAGTSTGAIIATLVALGKSVDEIRQFYLDSGRQMFEKASLRHRLTNKYADDALAAKLKQVVGAETTFGTDDLHTLLLIVMRNASTDSPWPLSNNPNAKYNRAERRDQGKASNLDLPLWQLVRASTAAPTYFPPERIAAGGQTPFLMVDGGVTTYNNPAFLLFLMATIEPYQLQWPTGQEQMLLVSVGTGTSPKANLNLSPRSMNLIYNATSIPAALMFGALNEQDMLCRTFGDCRHGAELDAELGDMRGAGGPVSPKLFTYLRYNPELSRQWLDSNGLPDVQPDHVQAMDSVAHLDDLQSVGRAYGRQVRTEHFNGF